MNTTHIAFDVGLHTTGVAWDGHSDHHTCPPLLRRSPVTAEQSHRRHIWWTRTFATILADHPAHTPIVVEAPFAHPKHLTGSIRLIALHGALRTIAGDRPYHEIPPAQLKRWATGRGNANKADMIEAARVRGWPPANNYHYPEPLKLDDNEADAWLLWCMWAAGARRGGGR